LNHDASPSPALLKDFLHHPLECSISFTFIIRSEYSRSVKRTWRFRKSIALAKVNLSVTLKKPEAQTFVFFPQALVPLLCFDLLMCFV